MIIASIASFALGYDYGGYGGVYGGYQEGGAEEYVSIYCSSQKFLIGGWNFDFEIFLVSYNVLSLF